MKISINSNLIEGAWGGGNKAIQSIYKALLSKGHSVCTDLRSSDIELILMNNPNTQLKSTSYGIDEINDYIALHPNAILVHRLNTSGEFHRGTGAETDLLYEANKSADFTVFISNFLKDLYRKKGFDISRPHRVIMNGAEENIFSPVASTEWKGDGKLKVVTHHWSANYMKGFDIYERLGLLLGTKPFSDLFEFTIIGNIPIGIDFKNTTIIKPISGPELASAIKRNHVYLTASRNEGAGMHHIEGMRCGLPVLYLNSGALPEYCSPYGIEFTLIDFEQKLMEILVKYAELRQKVLSCPYTATAMAFQYVELFEELVRRRNMNPHKKPGLNILIKHYLITKPYRRINIVVTLANRVFKKFS